MNGLLGTDLSRIHITSFPLMGKDKGRGIKVQGLHFITPIPAFPHRGERRLFFAQISLKELLAKPVGSLNYRGERFYEIVSIASAMPV